MIKINKLQLLLTFALLSLPLCTQTAFGQSTADEVLNKRIEQFEMTTDNIHHVLSRLASEYEVPIGLEVAAGGAKSYQIMLNSHNQNLRDLLNDITAQDSRYEWTVVEGVVNVFPREDRDDFLDKLLNTRVRQFSVRNKISKFEVKTDIKALPEIRFLLEQAKINYSVETFFIGEDLEIASDSPLAIHDATLREILNHLIRTSNSRYWIVNRYGKKNENLVLNF